MPEAARAWVEPLVAHRVALLRRALSRASSGPSDTPTPRSPRREWTRSCASASPARPARAMHHGEAAVEVGPRRGAARGRPRPSRATLVVDARGPEAAGSRRAGRASRSSWAWSFAWRSRSPRRGPCVMDAKVAPGGRLPLRVRAAPRRRPRPGRGHILLGHRSPRPGGTARTSPRLRARERALSLLGSSARRRASCPSPGRARCRAPGAPPLVAGYAGGFFHPVTGYSFPVAVRLASLVASLPPERALGAELAGASRGDTAPRPASPTCSTG